MTRPFRRLDAKAMILKEGVDPPQCFMLLEGWVGSFSTSRHGHRAMTKIYMPGDLLGNTSLGHQEMAETLISLSAVAIAALPHNSVGALFEAKPRLASLLYLIAQEERVRQMDWITCLLRLRAPGRIAALLLDLHDRHRVASGGDDGAIPFHLSQYDIADLTGLTATHTNRILQQFRHDQAIDLKHHALTILDREKLEHLADRPTRRIDYEPNWLPAAA